MSIRVGAFNDTIFYDVAWWGHAAIIGELENLLDNGYADHDLSLRDFEDLCHIGNQMVLKDSTDTNIPYLCLFLLDHSKDILELYKGDKFSLNKLLNTFYAGGRLTND